MFPLRYATRSLYLLISFSILLLCCGEEEPENPSLELLSITANGIPLVDGTINVDTEANIELTFSGALDANRFAAAFQLEATAGSTVSELSISYGNAASKAIINTTLAAATEYRLRVSAGLLGQDNSILGQAIERTFTTRAGGPITSLPPCISASADCLRSTQVSPGSGGQGTFTFYSSFPLDLDNARWENLTAAVIVVHGLSRNADDYFNYLMSSLRNERREEETLLLAPYFKNAAAATPGELYWSNSGWREGQGATAPANISSFSVLDEILAILGDPSQFPVLETVVIAGHSSGALYAQTYAAASTAEEQYPNLNFHYVVANSQYFYYPLDIRYDPASQDFGPVTGCPTYNHWPLGFVNTPAYLNGTAKEAVDTRITTRKLTYLLGTQDIVTTGTLNTADCEAVLLGENRFRRGENIYRLVETRFPALQQSEKVLVNGVGHNGQQMFQSAEFISWLSQTLP
jgi:hypothetical protein